MQPVDCNHYGSFIPCSGILQPQSEQDLRQWSPCIGWSFGSEPEPSEARVSPATHVVEGLFIDSVCSCAFHKNDVGIGLHALVGQISYQQFIMTVLLFHHLLFCSLNENYISNKGAYALSGALKVNQSLQKLQWVQQSCPTSQDVFMEIQCTHGTIAYLIHLANM